MCRAKEITNNFLNMTKEIKQKYEHNITIIENLELATQDFLHEIELGTLNAAKRVQTFNKLRYVRQERRRLKDENQTLIYLYDMFKPMNNFEKDLQKTMSNIDKTLNKLEHKEYYPRVRDDLTIGKKINLNDLKNKLESRNVG